MSVNFQTSLKTVDGSIVKIERLSRDCEIGRLYARYVQAEQEYGAIVRPLRELQSEESELERKVLRASIHNTTAEQFSIDKARLELVQREVARLQSDMRPAAGNMELSEQNLAQVQQIYFRELREWENDRPWAESEAKNLMNRMLSRVSLPA